MKHRGVKICKIKVLDAIDIGRRENSPVRAVYKTYYSPIGMNIPLTLDEAKECADSLILKVMELCKVDEKEAVKLINTN